MPKAQKQVRGNKSKGNAGQSATKESTATTGSKSHRKQSPSSGEGRKETG
jgi:hypothetical protein